ncbi:MAG TPA: hypothetical protein VFK21_08895 [Gammaproteobacteria bacterium]|nr:hypothetical protein [Gammaproteobacteria bacterium]
MVSLTQLWLPILLAAVGVHIASAIIHMFLHFWHSADYHGFSNEDAVQAAIGKGNPAAGIYMVPYCKPEDMRKPETIEKFKKSPQAFLFVRTATGMNMTKPLIQWFLFCLLVALFGAYVAGATLAAGTAGAQVCRVVATVSFMAFGFGTIPYAIWFGEPWKSIGKALVDALIYGFIAGGVFAWLWPAAAAVA